MIKYDDKKGTLAGNCFAASILVGQLRRIHLCRSFTAAVSSKYDEVSGIKK